MKDKVGEVRWRVAVVREGREGEGRGGEGREGEGRGGKGGGGEGRSMSCDPYVHYLYMDND